MNQNGYDNSETAVGKFLVRRTQVFRVQNFLIHFHLFFKISFQMLPEKLRTRQIRIRLVEYSSDEVLNPSEGPWIDGKLIFLFS